MRNPTARPPVEHAAAPPARCALLSLVLASACALVAASCAPLGSDEPGGDVRFIADVWGIDVPVGTTMLGYDTSEHDAQGGRDDVYVLRIEPERRIGFWDPIRYGAPPTLDDNPSVSTISASSGASYSSVQFQGLACREPVTRHQDSLLTCFDAAGDCYILFEQLF